MRYSLPVYAGELVKAGLRPLLVMLVGLIALQEAGFVQIAITTVAPGDFWQDFPSQINPPEDWPTMPQTVHIDFDLVSPVSGVVLHVWASYHDVYQGERLQVEIDSQLVNDVAVTNGWPAVDYQFPLGDLGLGAHRLSLTNTGGGGTVFDYLQLTPEPMTLCLVALGGVVALRRQKYRP